MNQTYLASKGNSTKLLSAYHDDLTKELNDILDYWMSNTHDTVYGGFIGRVDENNIPDPSSPKGAVVNARILWSFASAYKLTHNPRHLHLARIAFNYFLNHFIDKEYGGVYWSVTASGQPLDTKKQIYAIAFAIYGCSAYYSVSKNPLAKETAIQLYREIEAYSFDKEYTGYLEAFTRDWKPTNDLRLSTKDANEKKTMNTHLHVLEAYTSLYHIWPDAQLGRQIKNLLQNFTDHIVDAETGHLILFFDEEWNAKSRIISYGHDIEAAWLLLEAATALNDGLLLEKIRSLSVKISIAAIEGLDKDGGMWYEKEAGSSHIIKEKHWWVQAEAMIGFLNHWQLTGDDNFLEKSFQSWSYTRKFIKDKEYGEWLWGRNDDGTAMKNQDKVGIWKCPYHNTRACIEIIGRLQTYLVPEMAGRD
ncbi:MAG: AGE family epimerase/isomerase [Ferruginibacter sp.]